MGFYGAGGLCEAATRKRSLNVEGLGALVLRTHKPHGSQWDLRRREDRDLATHLVDTLKQILVFGSPPCAAFNSWNIHLDFEDMPANKIDEFTRLKFKISIYTIQHGEHRFVLHEQPAGAGSCQTNT